MNKKPRLAWDLYLKMETCSESFNLIQMIANDCYKVGVVYYVYYVYYVYSFSFSIYTLSLSLSSSTNSLSHRHNSIFMLQKHLMC